MRHRNGITSRARVGAAASAVMLGLLGTLTGALTSAQESGGPSGFAPPKRAAVGPEAPFKELPYTPSLDVSAMDRAADPCDDLYQYSCGGWIKNNPIPPDQTRWSVYSKATVDNQRYLWGILEDAAKPVTDRTSTQQKIGDYFAACMDTDAIERAGVLPLRDDLSRIQRLTDRKQLAALLGDLHQHVSSSGLFFGVYAAQDAEDASKVIANVDAGGLGLPDRDYYIKTDAKSVETREKYVAHITRMFELLGDTSETAKANAATVLRIETALAKASLTKVDRRDPHKIYHRNTLKSLPKIAPAFDWGTYFKTVGMTPDPWLNVTEPAFFRELNARLAKESLRDLKTFLRWALVDASASYLSSPFVKQNFAFYRQYLRGAETDRPRWKKCVAWVDRDLGEALGREFVARTFPAETKEKTVKMTRQIEDVMKARIEQLDWMSPATKKQAIAKLGKMRNKVGYPDIWRDYSALTVGRADFYENVSRAATFETKRQAAKIGKPVDKGEWSMSAPTVNAYYDPTMNQLALPAGQLQPPFFGAKFHPAVNFGSTAGGTIGHEMTHGFDDEGSQFDADGNLKDWWSAATKKAFGAATQCVVDQYAKYEAVPGVKLDGKLTAGENLADIGGVKIAFQAYHAWRAKQDPLPAANVEGFSDDQLYYLAYGQSWCAKINPESLETMAHTNPHSPPRWRVNGVIVDQPGFAEAFHCAAGTPMNPGKACSVW